jgi:DNA-binding CsgD family transcriptional regulator
MGPLRGATDGFRSSLGVFDRVVPVSAILRHAPSAKPESAEAAIFAHFLLRGRLCVVVPAHQAPRTGRARLGTLSLDGQRYAVDGALEPLSNADPVERLTPREFEIAMLIAAGCCNKAIGRRLGISSHTVGAHIGRIFAKLDVHKRAELMARIAHRLMFGGVAAD